MYPSKWATSSDNWQGIFLLGNRKVLNKGIAYHLILRGIYFLCCGNGDISKYCPLESFLQLIVIVKEENGSPQVERACAKLSPLRFNT